MRTEVPLAAGMLPPEEPPAGRVAVPVVRGALEPLVLLPLSLLVRPLLLLELPELLLSLESLESELLELGLLELSLSLLSEELLVLLVRPLELLLEVARSADCPVILETPGDAAAHAEEIATLRHALG